VFRNLLIHLATTVTSDLSYQTDSLIRRKFAALFHYDRNKQNRVFMLMFMRDCTIELAFAVYKEDRTVFVATFLVLCNDESMLQ